MYRSAAYASVGLPPEHSSAEVYQLHLCKYDKDAVSLMNVQ